MAKFHFEASISYHIDLKDSLNDFQNIRIT